MELKYEVDNCFLSSFCYYSRWRNIFSGLENGKNLIKSDQMLNSYYSSKSDCEKTLTKLKGQNNILEVNSFYNNKAKIVTNKVPLINKKRIVVNAFQCLNIE